MIWIKIYHRKVWQFKLVPTRPPNEDTGVRIYLCMYCALVAGFGFGFYELMQPERYPNPGVAAYKPTAAAGIGDVPQFLVGSNSKSVATLASANTASDEVKKSDPPASRAKRTRITRERRDPRMDYAAQAYPGGYRSWNSNRSWDSYRSWNSNQSWFGNRPWH